MNPDPELEAPASPAEGAEETSAQPAEEKVTLSKADFDRLTGLEKQYKNLQRELDKARRTGTNSEDLRTSMDAIREQVGLITDALVAAGVADGGAKEQILQAKQRASARDAITPQLREISESIVEALEDSSLEWDTDPRLSDARAAWSEGKTALDRGDPSAMSHFLRAQRLAQKTARGVSKVSPEAIEKTVEEKVEESLKKSGARKVDTGDGAPTPKIDLEKWRKLPPDERLKRLPEIRKLYG